MDFHIPSHAAYASNHRPDSRVWCFMGYPPESNPYQMNGTTSNRIPFANLKTPDAFHAVNPKKLLFPLGKSSSIQNYTVYLYTIICVYIYTYYIYIERVMYMVYYIYIVMYIIYIVIYSYVYYIYSYIYVCVQYVFIYIYTIHVCKWKNNGFAVVDFRTPRAWPFSRPSTSPARPSWHAAWNRVAGSSGTGQIWGSSLGWAKHRGASWFCTMEMTCSCPGINAIRSRMDQWRTQWFRKR